MRNITIQKEQDLYLESLFHYPKSQCWTLLTLILEQRCPPEFSYLVLINSLSDKILFSTISTSMSQAICVLASAHLPFMPIYFYFLQTKTIALLWHKRQPFGPLSLLTHSPAVPHSPADSFPPKAPSYSLDE